MSRISVHAQRVFFISGVLLLALGNETGFAQNATLSGRVVDAETDTPLPGAHVFINHTLMGTATDERGTFEVENISPGSYELITSMLGYETATKHLVVTPEQPLYDSDVRLEPAVLEMAEVEITARRPRRWKRDLKRFEELFVGTGPNSGKTHILNPYVLDFETNGDVFFARASAPLEVQNLALGYRINFVLTEFRMDLNTNLLHIHGPFHFEELS
jgi:hypothetical protein